jgi:hypothetical protein
VQDIGRCTKDVEMRNNFLCVMYKQAGAA